jgi:DNA modification methylase
LLKKIGIVIKQFLFFFLNKILKKKKNKNKRRTTKQKKKCVVGTSVNAAPTQIPQTR